MVALPTLGGAGRSLAAGIAPLQLGGGLIELAVLFFVLAIVAAVVGARGVAGLSMRIAKWLVLVFLVLAVVSLLL
ncbi:DUF1328 family protein [Haloarcula litorea]|uniref:DUF1328 family protein n=1 Tax=Haloarcula litorea TaxID=3032579 RepID=UPI0023E8B9EC|nr:DUF1328 family protein [Halomicroarcula sp. GDY20]